MPYTRPGWTFIELVPFARARDAYGMEDAEFAELEALLIRDPYAGDVIPGSDGCRKMRWRAHARGKRGGYRVIYFLRVGAGTIVLVALYSKNVRDNIRPSVLKALKARYQDGQDDN